MQVKQNLVMKEGENDCEGFVSRERGSSTFLNASSFYLLLATVVGSSMWNCEKNRPKLYRPSLHRCVIARRLLAALRSS